MRRKTLFLISAFLLIISLYLLTSSSPILVKPVYEGSNFLVGTLVAWLAIIALPISIYYGLKKMSAPGSRISRLFSTLLKWIILLSCLWAPIGYLFSGNWAFTFERQEDFPGGAVASQYFWIFTSLVVLLPIIFLVTYLLYRLLLLIFRNKRIF